MVTDLLVGLDLGSTSFKAVATSFSGRELAIARIPTPWRRESEGATMTPQDLADAAEDVLESCLKQTGESRVVSLGITGMAEAGFLVNQLGECLAPAYAWFDRRGTRAAAELEAWAGPWFSNVTGLPISPRASIAKLRFLHRAHEPGLTWESLPEWTARYFGGGRRAELTLASRTGMFDQQTRDWHPELLEWAGLERSEMKSPVPAGEPWGRTKSRIPAFDGAVLTVAGHDHICAALGAGALRDGDAFDSLGTGEAVLASTKPLSQLETARAVKQGFAVGAHVVPRRSVLLAGLGTGARLSHVLKILGISTQTDLHQLEQEALLVESSPEIVWTSEIVRDGLFLEDVSVTSDEKPNAWRAALNAAGRRLDETLNRLEAFIGARERVIVSGGWYRSNAFNSIRTESVSWRLSRPRIAEATGVGAALLGGAAADIFESVESVPVPWLEEL